MKIKLARIKLENFKGVERAEFEFINRESFIHGDNGEGKTTLYDAFLWTLFGKDHEDRADYRIKPIGPTGELLIKKVECSVELSLVIDDVALTLKRVYKENWRKPKTEPDEVYDGDTTVFFINGISVMMREYNDKIIELFRDREVFKSITNTRYFTSFNQSEQRKLLFGMVPEITDAEIASVNNDFIEILKEVSGVSIEAFKKDLQSKKTRIKDELKGLPDRIKGLELSLPEQKDWSEIELKISQLNSEMKEIDDKLLDLSRSTKDAGEKRMAIQNKLNDIEIEINQLSLNERNSKNELISGHTSKINSLRLKISEIESEQKNKELLAKSKEDRRLHIESEIKLKEDKLEVLRSEWRAINSETISFPEGAFICPTCKRSLDFEDIDAKQKELTDAFNKRKSERLEDNKKTGLRIVSEINELKQELERTETKSGEATFAGTKIDVLKAEIKEIEDKIQKIIDEPESYQLSDAYRLLISQKSELVSSLENVSNEQKPDFIVRKDELNEELARLQKELGAKDVIDNTLKLIDSHNKSFRTMNQELSDLEKKEYILKQFEYAKINAYESSVNSLFTFVKFKLFETQKDGQVVPTCEATVNGIPYGTLNYGAQINAGLDIINAISKVKNMYAPIFIDNRESITSIPEIEAQVINLVKVTGDKLHLEK